MTVESPDLSGRLLAHPLKGLYGASVVTFAVTMLALLFGAMSYSDSDTDTTRVNATVTSVTCSQEDYVYAFQGHTYRNHAFQSRGCFKNSDLEHPLPVWISPDTPDRPDLDSPGTNKGFGIVLMSVSVLTASARLWCLAKTANCRTPAGNITGWILAGIAAFVALTTVAGILLA